MMFKKILLTSLVLCGLVFSGMVAECFAGASAQLEQAETYKKAGSYLQAEGIYQIIAADYPGTDDALKAQKELVILYNSMGRSADSKAALDKLTADFSEHPDLPKVLYDIARQYEWSAKYKEAKSINQQIVQQHSKSWYVNNAQLAALRTNIMSLIVSGNDSEAQKVLDKLVEDFSKHMDLPAALYSIARRYEWSHKYEEAKSVFQQITQQYPHSSYTIKAQLDVPRMNVLSHIMSGNYSEAQAALDKLVEDFSEYSYLLAALYNIAERYEYSHKYEEAKSIFQQITQRYPHSSYANRAQLWAPKMDVLLFIDLGDDAETQKNLDKIVEDFPKHSDLPGVLYDIAGVYEKSGKYEKAESIYQDIVINYLGTNYAFRALRRLIILDTGVRNGAEAQKTLDKLVEVLAEHPDLPAALYGIAGVYERSEKYEEAKSIYQDIVTNYSGTDYAFRAQRHLVILDIGIGNNAEAQEALDKLVKDFAGHPDLPAALYDIAGRYGTSKEYEEAESIYQDIVTNYSGSDYALRAQKHLATLDTSVGNDTEAQVALDKLVEDFAGHADLPAALYDIAGRYEESEKYEEAIDVYQSIIANCPGTDYALNAQKRLAILGIGMGNAAEIQEAIDKLVEDFVGHPDLPKALFTIGEEYYNFWMVMKDEGLVTEANDHLIKAIAVFERITQELPASAVTVEAYYFSAVCYCHLGEYEKAKSIYQKIIQQYPDSSQAAKAQLSVSRINMLSLSLKEQERAISFFEYQHRSWLTIKSGLAQYKTTVRNIKEGEFLADPASSQTGTLEFVITPLDNPIKRQSPAKVQIRLSNDKYKWNFVKDNVFDSEASSWQWADDPNVPIGGETTKLFKEVFQTELFFLPLDFMAKTYPDELWVWDDKHMMLREKFFVDRGLPIRRSTQEETNNIFGGEPQYLFMASPALVDAHYWFSAENGELRHIDVFLPEGLVKSFRYENYVRGQDGNASLPRRFILTWKKGSGDEAFGWEYTVELTNVELNIDIPAERFIPPQVDH